MNRALLPVVVLAGLFLLPPPLRGAPCTTAANGSYKAIIDPRGRMTVWRDNVPVVTRSYAGMFGRLPSGSLIYYASAGYALSTPAASPLAGLPRLVAENQGKEGVGMFRQIVLHPDHIEWTHRMDVPPGLAGSIDTGFVLNPDLSIAGTVRLWTTTNGPAKTGTIGAAPACLPYSTPFVKAEFVSRWGSLTIAFQESDGLEARGTLLNLAKSSRRPEPKVMILPLSVGVKKKDVATSYTSVCTLRFDPLPGIHYLPAQRNAILNGSFEAWSNPDLPDGWRRSPAATKRTAAAIAADPTAHVHGTRSLKWTGGEATLSQIPARGHYRLTTPLTPPVTFSLTLKSNPPGVRLEMSCGKARKTVTAAENWQRHDLVVASGKDFPIRLKKLSPGTLWLDAVQLERGKEPTPYVNRPMSEVIGQAPFQPDLLHEALQHAEDHHALLTGPGPERSYYTRESTGRLRYRIRLEPKERIRSDVRIRILGKDGRVLQRQRQTPGPDGRIVVPFKVASLPLGTATAQAELWLDGNKRADMRSDLIRLAPLKKGSETKIDRHARILLRDGKPFLPVGSDTASSVSRALEAIQAQKANGFNTIHVWSGFAERSYAVPARLPVFHPAELKTMLDAALAADMAVIVHLGHWLTINHSERDYYHNPAITDAQTLAAALDVVRAAQHHPALLLWYLFDEPAPRLCPPAYLEHVLHAVKDVDPYHPALVNFCGSAERILSYRATTDLLAIDIYPVPQTFIGVIAPHARLMWEIGEWRPVLWWIQAWASLREPTAEEERCMTYQALVEGTRAILFYNYRPSSYAAWNGLGTIAAEMQALHETLASPVAADVSVHGGNGRIVATARRSADGWDILAVNRSRQAVEASLSLPAARKTGDEDIEVLFENRRLRLDNGTLRDHFAPLARHVYRLQEQ